MKSQIHNPKGFMLAQALIEAIVVIVSIVVLLQSIGGFLIASRREDVKLMISARNVLALEQVRTAYYESGDESVMMFSEAFGDYITETQNIDSVNIAGTEVYRVVIDTSHKNKNINGTELIAYVAPQ